MAEEEEPKKLGTYINDNLREELQLFDSNLDHYLWKGEVEPVPKKTEKIIRLLKDKLTAYQKIQISESQVMVTNERLYVWGNRVKGTLVASMVSREYEQRRHLSGFDPIRRKDRSPDLFPFTKAGFAINHEDVRQIQIIAIGSRFSLYFFTSENSHLFRINDVIEDELQVIKELYHSFGVEMKHGEFILPLRDMILICSIAAILLIIGWFIIVIIF